MVKKAEWVDWLMRQVAFQVSNMIFYRLTIGCTIIKCHEKTSLGFIPFLILCRDIEK